MFNALWINCFVHGILPVRSMAPKYQTTRSHSPKDPNMGYCSEDPRSHTS